MDETERPAWGGMVLSDRAILIQIKSDFLEVVTSLGYALWNSVSWPCAWCSSDQDSLHVRHEGGPLDWPWDLTTIESYEEACARCEIWIRLRSMDDVLRLRANLGRKPTANGRALKVDLVDLHLKAGDRFEPSEHMFDWKTLYTIKDLPVDGVVVCF